MSDTAIDPPDRGDDERSKARLAFLNREAAEVYILLDYLSGRADRSLVATPDEQARTLLQGQLNAAGPSAAADESTRQREQIESDLKDPTRLVLRAMEIRYPLKPDRDGFEANAAFLIRARDVLNTRAWPATGLTIAFTSMVLFHRLHLDCFFNRAVSTLSFGRLCKGRPEELADAPDISSQFAAEAYPDLVDASRRLARSTVRIMYWMFAVLAVTVVISAYTAWGKVLLDTLDAARRDLGETELAIEKVEHSPEFTAALGPHGAESVTVRLCDRPTILRMQATKSDVQAAEASSVPDRFDTPDEAHVCDRLSDVNRRIGITYSLLGRWRFRALINGVMPDQWAVAALSVIGNYILPVLYALLGSMAFVLRRYHDCLANFLLTTRDQRANMIRLALGALTGACVGLFFNSSASASQTTGILGASLTLSASGIAFLGGYGVEGVFKLFDALISQIFRTNPAEQPAPRASR